MDPTTISSQLLPLAFPRRQSFTRRRRTGTCAAACPLRPPALKHLRRRRPLRPPQPGHLHHRRSPLPTAARAPTSPPSSLRRHPFDRPAWSSCAAAVPSPLSRAIAGPPRATVLPPAPPGDLVRILVTHCSNAAARAYIYNITSPYTDSGNRVAIVGTSVAMFTLSVLFFNLAMFRRLSRGIRLARSVAVSLFLPVMSYLFSEVKQAAAGSISSATIAEVSPRELPLRARLILSWLLLVELLRKKAQPMWVPAAAGTQVAGNAESTARVVWLGCLVFTSIQNPGRRAVFGVLWSVAAAKMVQRIVITEVIRRSFAAGWNHEVISAYLPQGLGCPSRSTPNVTGCPLASCDLAVMGEDGIEKKAGPRGWVAVGDGTLSPSVVTVRKVWTEDKLPRPARRLCFSFALFKLLRRRLEDPRQPAAADDDAEARAWRPLILGRGCDLGPHELFRVLTEEVNFLSENYHSAIPVVLASPFFLLANYLVFPLTVLCLSAMTIVACGDGDVPGTFHSMMRDNYILSLGLEKTVVCLLGKFASSPPARLAAVDLSITFFLFVAYLYEELCEFLVFLLSDWFVVSLACSYVQDTRSRRGYRRAAIASAVRFILRLLRLFVRRRRCLLLKQFDVVASASACCCNPVALSAAVPVSTAAKASIVRYLREHGEAVLGDFSYALVAGQCVDLMAWCSEGDGGVARVILIWHVATAIFEAKHPHRHRDDGARPCTAVALSRYCAYLVAFRPELRPDDLNETQHVYEATVRELKEAFGSWGYYSLPRRARLEKLAEIAAASPRVGEEGDEAEKDSIVRNGAILGKALIDKVEQEARSEEELWNMLAEFWVELVVYVAPASDPGHLRGHLATLVEGGEFVTLLWALTTHLGVNRTVPSPPAGGASSCKI